MNIDNEVHTYSAELQENLRWGIEPVDVNPIQEYGIWIPVSEHGPVLRPPTGVAYSTSVALNPLSSETTAFNVHGYLLTNCYKTTRLVQTLKEPRYFSHIEYHDPSGSIRMRSYASILVVDLILQKARKVTMELQTIDDSLSSCFLRGLGSKQNAVRCLDLSFVRFSNYFQHPGVRSRLRVSQKSLVMLSLAFTNNCCVRQLSYYYGRNELHRPEEQMILVYILNGLRRNPSVLQQLTLTGNHSDRAIRELLDYLNQSTCRLKDLTITGIRFTEFLSFAQHVRNPLLQKLDITDCTPSVDPYEQSHLGNLYNVFPGLKKLLIFAAPIRDPQPLQAYWRDNATNLVELHLTDCQIGEDEIIEFSRDLSAMTNLKILKLDWNPFTAQFNWQDIFEENLLQNTCIEDLSIRYQYFRHSPPILPFFHHRDNIFFHLHGNVIKQRIGNLNDEQHKWKWKLWSLILHRVICYSSSLDRTYDGGQATMVNNFLKQNLQDILGERL